MKKRKFKAAMLLVCLSAAITATAQEKDFYEDKQRGWFWYEDPIEPEKIEPPKPVIPTPQTQSQKSSKPEEDTIKLDLVWIRDNLDSLRDKAIESPTEENLAVFAYAQRLMLDYSSRFSTNMMRFMESEPLLNEDMRRPTSAVALARFSEQTREQSRKIIDKVNDVAHLWFFYRSDCKFCHQQIPILDIFHREYNTEILAISMDGIQLDGMENFQHVVDTDQKVSKRLGVERTPTIFMVTNDGSQQAVFSSGLETVTSLVDRMVTVAFEAKIITNEEYQLAQSVREISVFRDETGQIIADKETLENDPGYLADLLKVRLTGSSNDMYNKSLQGKQ